MSATFHRKNVPELSALSGGAQRVRIPPEQDVPLTRRVRRLIDTAAFRRLQGVSQLGLVRLVYPGAVHTRFEHSLGVYRLALLFLSQLDQDSRFQATVDDDAANLFIASALLHDIGHWPYCHPMEDIRLPGIPTHEDFAGQYLERGEIADLLREDWGVDGASASMLLRGASDHPAGALLSALLSGPIDIDKMDYLQRDSLHAGVPYGRNFDQGRLVGSLCVNSAGNGLAISDKGKTAAEMMVFARYVMFSEVYWHHTVRSATAMLQRALYEWREQIDLPSLFCLSEADFTRNVAQCGEAAHPPIHNDLWQGLFGERRRLYKRLAQFNYTEHPEIHARLARKSYAWLVRASSALADRLSSAIGERVLPHHILIDAPPVDREVEFRVEVHDRKQRIHRPLDEVSPVVRVLAKEQFDDFVKRVRIFIHPTWAHQAALQGNLLAMLAAAADDAEHQSKVY